MQPQMSRKPLSTKPTNLKSKNSCTSLVKSQSVKYESNQQIADLRVECLNKDKTIQEHERHIEEIKDEMRKLEAELEELHKKQAAIEEQHKKEMEKMVDIIFSKTTCVNYYGLICHFILIMFL